MSNSCGRRRRLLTGWITFTALALALGAGATRAQEEEGPATGWFDEAELSLVATDGNARAETFSLRNTLRRVWDGAELKITIGGLRAESTTLSRSAVGTSAQDARLVESSISAVTAERYFFETRYDRAISERWYWYAAADWDRDEPAGVRNRFIVSAGVGNIWFERDEARFRTDYALTYTDQEDVVEPPGRGGGFAGLRLSWDYWRRLTGTTELANLLTVDQNLDDGDDLRAVMVNSLAVKMSESMALKLGHELRFDNQPSLIAVPVTTADGAPVGEDLLVEADEVDTTLSLALVVSF